ncbi:MAG: hypothetical protein QM755_08630 [Luteolibacter sp.]
MSCRRTASFPWSRPWAWLAESPCIGNARKLTLKRGGGGVEQVDLKEITTGKAKDIPLRDGDVITIPESLF